MDHNPLSLHCFAMHCRAMEKLRSYSAAKREIAPDLDHWSHKGLNNRAENRHLPFRKRERVMQGFLTPGGYKGLLPFIPPFETNFHPRPDAAPQSRSDINYLRHLMHGMLRPMLLEYVNNIRLFSP